MRVSGLHHLALRVESCERSLAFYGGVLGLSELRRRERGGVIESIWLAMGEAVLMIEARLRGIGASQGSGHVLAFGVSDLRPWEDLLTRAGVPIDDRTEHTLYVRDPDGHRVGLSRYDLLSKGALASRPLEPPRATPK